MKKHYLLKVVLTFVLIFSVSLPFANSSAEAAKKVSYLMNTEKEYTYNNYMVSVSKITFKFDKKDDDFNWWFADIGVQKGEQETKDGLYDYDGFKLLAYPIKKNKTWTNNHIRSDMTWKITSVNKTIKVKAGTFKNVVEVKSIIKGYKGYQLTYYAPNVGMILSKHINKETKFKAKKAEELIKLKNK